MAREQDARAGPPSAARATQESPRSYDFRAALAQHGRARARRARPPRATPTGCRRARASASARREASSVSLGAGAHRHVEPTLEWKVLERSERPHDRIPLRPAARRRPGQAARLSASPPCRKTKTSKSSRSSLRTAGVATVDELIQKRDKPHPNHYLGTGKLEELKPRSRKPTRTCVVFDDELTPRQQRNARGRARRPGARPHRADPRHLRAARAERRRQAAGRARAARSTSCRACAGCGRLELSRLRAAASAGAARARPSSRSTAAARATASRCSSAASSSSRRRARRSAPSAQRAQLPTVAIVGYTNAGKSTLLNALTGADVLVENRLFATLDPTTRRCASRRPRGLMTDTVGFIRDLPQELVAAFAATLEETARRRPVLHVVDASARSTALDELRAAGRG